MADEKKKPGLAAVIAASDGDDESTEEVEGSDSFDAAASEAFDALKSGDVEGFKTALRAAMASC